MCDTAVRQTRVGQGHSPTSIIIDDHWHDSDTSHSDSESLSPPSPLFQWFQTVINTLPHTVPVAVSTDSFACFSGNSIIKLGADEDAWEVVDKALNHVISYGVSMESVSHLIQRGNLGIDGLYRWLTSGKKELNIYTYIDYIAPVAWKLPTLFIVLNRPWLKFHRHW